MSLRAVDPAVAVPSSASSQPLRLSAPRGKPCTMGWVAIADLRIDDSYQRPIDRRGIHAIRSIAQKFDWARFDALVVAPLGDGTFAIVDGQHRTHAAAMLGIEKVPCRIVMVDRKDQAATFAAINGDVLAVNEHVIFKAALAAGERWAVDSAAMCEKAGARLMDYNKPSAERKAFEIYCLSTIREWAEYRFDHGVILLGALADSAQGGAEQEPWSGRILPVWMDTACRVCAERAVPVAAQRTLLGKALDGMGQPLAALHNEARLLVAQRKKDGAPSCSARMQFSWLLADALGEWLPEARR